jgi:NCAIR mutase (PurE)-related protein
MSPQELRKLLQAVQDRQLEVDAALEQLLPALAEVDLGFAHVDLERSRRCGFPEVIFCEGKTADWVEEVVHRLVQARQDCLATRLNAEQAERLARRFPQGQQDPLARTFWLPAGPPPSPRGRVQIVTAGTSDLPVAREALVTAQALGCQADLLADVGVAGIHRLLRHRQQLLSADVIVVVAGMDGALPSVVGGLVSCPVIAVPTSVGYGAAFSGLAPLLTMLNACAANVVVVNIDSGFKAGYVAALIARRSVPAATPTAS